MRQHTCQRKLPLAWGWRAPAAWPCPLLGLFHESTSNHIFFWGFCSLLLASFNLWAGPQRQNAHLSNEASPGMGLEGARCLASSRYLRALSSAAACHDMPLIQR